MIKAAIKKVLPPGFVAWLKSQRRRAVANLKPLSEEDFTHILREELGIRRGDTVFVHSSFSLIKAGFGPDRLLEIWLDVLGPQGNLIVPSYPPKGSLQWLEDGETFDLRHTKSSMGVFTELVRRHEAAVRSLHPTKACAVIGPDAVALTAEHHLSPLPYDRPSPYYKARELNAKLVGLGVWTYNLSFVHTSEDTLRERHPFCPHYPRLFDASVADVDGRRHVVKTFAHDLLKIGDDTSNVPHYMKKYIDPAICADRSIQGRRFFIGHARPLYAAMTGIAQTRGETLFQRAQRSTTREKEVALWRELLRLTSAEGIELTQERHDSESLTA